MGGFLTLDDAAEKLGVEYKTLYRLVRNGDLPAGKIGRIYRIRVEDLNAYFERQKQLTATGGERIATSMSVCCVCGARLLSQLSIAGMCEESGGLICQACWHIKNVRKCKGIGSPTRPSADGSDALPVEPPMAESPHEQVARLRSAGRIVVSVDEARLAEEAFIRGFGQRMELIKTLPDPLSGTRIVLEKARGQHEILRNEDSWKVGNTRSRFVIKSGGWGQPKGVLHLEARFLSRPERLAFRGYDADPIDESHLLPVLGEIASEAATTEAFHVIVIGSPTGFDEAARRTVTDPLSSKGFRDRRALVVLQDLHSGLTYMDESDERATAFFPLTAPALFQQRVEQCMVWVESRVQQHLDLSLEQTACQFGNDEPLARTAFDRLVQRGRYQIEEITDLGTMIVAVRP